MTISPTNISNNKLLHFKISWQKWRERLEKVCSQDPVALPNPSFKALWKEEKEQQVGRRWPYIKEWESPLLRPRDKTNKSGVNLNTVLLHPSLRLTVAILVHMLCGTWPGYQEMKRMRSSSSLLGSFLSSTLFSFSASLPLFLLPFVVKPLKMNDGEFAVRPLEYFAGDAHNRRYNKTAFRCL